MHHRLGVEALKKFIASRHDPRLFFGQIDLIFVLWSRFRRFGFGFCSTRLFTLSPTKSREDIKDRYSWPMRNAVLAAPDPSLHVAMLLAGSAAAVSGGVQSNTFRLGRLPQSAQMGLIPLECPPLREMSANELYNQISTVNVGYRPKRTLIQ
jgi:hypothetical protein